MCVCVCILLVVGGCVCVCVCGCVCILLVVAVLSRVQLFATPWIVAHWLLCPRDFPDKNTGVGAAISFSRGSSQPKDRTHVSCIAGGLFINEPPGELSICSNTHMFLISFSIMVYYRILIQ